MEIAERDGIREGLICVITCVELCHTFSVVRVDPSATADSVTIALFMWMTWRPHRACWTSNSNTLTVRRNLGDIVNKGAGWIQQPNEVIGAVIFEVFTQGPAILKVQAVSNSPVIGATHDQCFSQRR